MFSPTVDMTGLFGEKHILNSILLLFSLSIHPAKNQVSSANESFWQLFGVIVSHPHIMDKNIVANLIAISKFFTPHCTETCVMASWFLARTELGFFLE